VPDAVFYTQFPARLIGKLKIKARRANQLISLWVKCFRLMLKRRLLLPETIALPEIMLSIFNPIILLALIVTAATTVVLSPLSLFSLGLILFVTGLLLFARKIFIEMLLDNLILFYALITFLFGRRYIVWEKTGS